jgi:hypothetical protein
MKLLKRSRVDNVMLCSISRFYTKSVFELSTDKPSIPGAIELVIQSLYLAHHLGLKQINVMDIECTSRRVGDMETFDREVNAN